MSGKEVLFIYCFKNQNNLGFDTSKMVPFFQIVMLLLLLKKNLLRYMIANILVLNAMKSQIPGKRKTKDNEDLVS